MGDDQQNVEEVVYDDDGGFAGYEETTVDPGPWLLIGTAVFCFGVMLVFVPIMVACKVRRRQNKQEQDSATQQLVGGKEPVDTGLCSVLSFNKETRGILKLAIPYTISALASSTFSNMCLILVSQHIGTKAVAAYALVMVLVGLTDGMLQGPIYACTTLCAHAVGAGNTILAGNYIQLAVSFYLLLNIPVIYFWWIYMYDIILYLEWGDDATALLAQEFIRVYIWSFILGGISTAIWQLLEVTDHAVAGTVISILWGFTNIVVIAGIVINREATLEEVGLAYIGTAVFYIGLTLVISQCRGWLKPFHKGLFGTVAICNWSAIKLMAKQAIPLAFGSLLSNAEWAVLTFFASHLGPAEVAAWAILGSIWEVFYSVTAGIGDAAEIRVAYHLGDNHPTMAKLSAYKSLLLGMMVASVVSVIYFSMQDRIPVWFTQDETLQAMLAELVPFVGIANLTMTFGMQCWSLIGAQGKYKLATWISFISSWGICMPLSALYVFVFHIDLQGLTSAVVIGYVSTGASLAFVLLSTDWYKVARKIQEQNAGTASGKAKDEDDLDNELYASLKPNSHAAKALARRNVRLITLPPGQRSGLLLGNIYNRPGTYVLMVRNWSPLQGSVKPGDAILAMDGVDLREEGAVGISGRLKTARMFDRHLSVAAPMADEEDVDPEYMLQQLAEDESTEAPATGSYKDVNLF